MADKRNVGWVEVSSLVVRLVKELQKQEFKPKNIVGVTRGGLIPAVMLSHALGIKNVYTLYASSYNDANQKGDLRVFADGAVQGVLTRRDTLIVDDIIDSGSTMQTVSFMWGRPLFCALMSKMHIARSIAVEYVPKETWINFPWESR